MTPKRKPLCIDLYAGLGGWAEGFLAEGWDVVGFDIERHEYGAQRYPAQLVLQDVLTLHGRQFRDVDCIVASPPCQRYSYMAMPWSRAKREVRWQQWERDSPFGDRLEGLRALFNSCFRIQREASEAADHRIPMVVENVKGAQPWVGPANAHFGSFYFWGDVGTVGGKVVAGPLRFGDAVRAARRGIPKATGVKCGGPRGDDWLAKHNRPEFLESAGIKQGGSGPEWFDQGIAKHSSKSDSRKAASAQIAKIPFPLASYIARSFRP
jgi:hypothetical protein